MDRLELKRFLNIDEEDQLVEGDVVDEATKGVETSYFMHLDSSGNRVAAYKIVRTTDFKGSGSLTWTRTAG